MVEPSSNVSAKFDISNKMTVVCMYMLNAYVDEEKKTYVSQDMSHSGILKYRRKNIFTKIRTYMNIFLYTLS
jgi:hypothetical protein